MSEAMVLPQLTDSDVELNERLKRRLAQISEVREKLAEWQRKLDQELNRIDEEYTHIAALLKLDGTSTSPAEANGEMPPGDPADLVVKLLRETGPLHYREIERQLRSRGWYHAGGVDPANTLLSKYFQDSRLYRPRRGVYDLRPEGATVQSVGTRRKRARGARRG